MRTKLSWRFIGSLLLIASLGLAAFTLNAQRFTEGQGGVPIDDAWIHFQIARNLARGDGFAFNPGQPTSGSTAPLWTVLLAGLYAVGGRFPTAGQALSAVALLSTVSAAYFLTRKWTSNRWTAWLAAAIVALNGRLIWAGLSAMEVGLFTTLTLLALLVHRRNRERLRRTQAIDPTFFGEAVLLGLAALTRPEGYLLFGMALLDTALGLAVHRRTGHRNTLLSLLGFALLFAAIVAPYMAFSRRTSGRWLPNTYHAKSTLSPRLSIDFLGAGAQYLILDNSLLVPFFLLGLILTLLRPRRPGFLLGLWCAGLPLAYAFLDASLYHHGRYLMPLIPCNAVLGMVGLLEARKLMAQRGSKWVRSSAVSIAAIVLIVVGTAWRLPTMGSLYAWNVDNINDMHVDMGQWAREQTAKDAILALNDIGAIAYISERTVIDLAGLVTPEVVPLLRSPDRGERLATFLESQGAEYAIIFPNWFPELASQRESLQPVHQEVLEHNTIAGGFKMVAYETIWSE